jgi:hypothetical protein
MSEQTPELVEVGWQVVDPDGNVVESGTGIVVQGVGGISEENQ